MTDYGEHVISQAGGEGEPDTGTVAFHRLSKSQILTLAIALQDQRDRARATVRELEAKLAEAKAEALEEAAKGLGWLGAQGNTVEPDNAWAGISACIRTLRDQAAKLRQP